jgi:hypothetical protein
MLHSAVAAVAISVIAVAVVCASAHDALQRACTNADALYKHQCAY